MGSGAWSTQSYVRRSTALGREVDTKTGVITDNSTAQERFESRHLDPALNPKNVIRECCDSEEHPNTIPVLLALDVTGSMGPTAMRVANMFNPIMVNINAKNKDVQTMTMGIGDYECDKAPIQVSQFESDIRIAEQLDKLYFEGGGGGNGYESYSGAWVFAANQTRLDCWKRGKKGILITMGDEPLNPVLPAKAVQAVTGFAYQGYQIDTADAYEAVKTKYEVYHIAVDGQGDNCYSYYEDRIKSSFGKYLDDKHLIVATLDELPTTITNIINTYIAESNGEAVNDTQKTGGKIRW